MKLLTKIGNVYLVVMKKTLIIIFLMAIVSLPAAAQTIRVWAAAQKEIYAGEPFQYQIVIEGHREPGNIDLSPLEKWSPQSLPGQDYSSTSVNIINNKKTVYEEIKYVMTYQLVANEAGQITLPPVKVEIKGQIYTTNPIVTNILKPNTTDKLVLDVEYSQTDCYVGQPITMTVTWYFGSSVSDYYFNIPVLADSDNFFIEDAETMPGGGEMVQIDLAVRRLFARKKQEQFEGGNYAAVTFSKILIPRQAGVIEIAAPSITCNLQVQSRQSRSRSFFDSPFFGSSSEYKRFSSKGKGASLNVKPLPQQDRPEDFNGLVGHYTISTSAEPMEVNVGDPVTFTIDIGGKLLKRIEMPDLQAIPEIAENFKIATDQSTPTTSGGTKTFTQTIRAKNDKVKEIPAIPFSFFDVDKGRYVTEYSKAIPLEVAPTRIVTAQQAEGWDIKKQTSEIEAVRLGIAANIYEQSKLLTNTAFSPTIALAQTGYLLLWVGPLAMFIILAVGRLTLQDSPARQRARRRGAAASRAITKLHRLDSQSRSVQEETADILRQYVGDRFDKTAQSLTSRDCREILKENCKDKEPTEQFCRILEQCEHSQYAGAQTDSTPINAREIGKLIKALEKNLK